MDLEAHIALDDRTYLVDCSRVLPPVRPTGKFDYLWKVSTVHALTLIHPLAHSHTHTHTHTRTYTLSQLFRAEFVELWAKKVGVPLSSDAYSPFSPDAPHNAHVDAATKYLLEVHIPSVAVA